MAIVHVFSNTSPDFTGTITGFNSQGSTATIAATNLVRPSDWNSSHNQLYTLSGNTNNASTASGTNIVLSGGSNITLIGSGSVIGFSAANHPMLSSWKNIDILSGTQTLKPTQSTFFVFPFQPDENFSADQMRLYMTISAPSSSFASTANTTFSLNQQETHRWVLYSRNTGASSMSLASVSSGSQSLHYSVNVGYGSASNTRQQHSFGLTYFNSDGSQTFSTIYSTSNVASIVISSASITALTGLKFMDFPFAGSLTPNDYWLAINHSTTITTQATNLSGVRFVNNIMGVSQLNNAIGAIGVANAASQAIMMGLGSFTTVGGASTESLGFSNISSSASNIIPILVFGRGFN